MSELRWNPLLGTWTMVASNRQARPNLPKDWCPFCPGSGKVPDDFEVLKYDNDFPVLTLNPAKPEVTDAGPYQVMPNYGKCEVVLYSPRHNARLWDLTSEHITRLVDLWAARSQELAQDPQVKYIFIFENRGEEVGVTMPHPHGQIYAYPFVPLKVKTELENARNYYQEHHRCLICDMTAEETRDRGRVLAENASFVAYLPFFTDYPYGVFIVSKRHLGGLDDPTHEERHDLARMLKNTAGAFDLLFDRPFPYMMCVHQTPVNSGEYADSGEYYHFHIEFYPPLRDKDKMKWYASSEMGAWAAANPVAVEESAIKMREAYERFAALSED